MSDPNLPRLIVRRFDVVCRVMEWDAAKPRWSMVEGKNVCRVHHYALEKAGRANRYSINATVNAQGGETTVHHACRGEEMLEWLDGILAGAGRFAPGAIRAAWAESNKVFGQ